MPDVPDAPGWHDYHGRKRFWNGMEWGAYWDAQDVEEVEQEWGWGSFWRILFAFVFNVIGFIWGMVRLFSKGQNDGAAMMLAASIVPIAALLYVLLA